MRKCAISSLPPGRQGELRLWRHRIVPATAYVTDPKLLFTTPMPLHKIRPGALHRQRSARAPAFRGRPSMGRQMSMGGPGGARPASVTSAGGMPGAAAVSPISSPRSGRKVRS